MGSLKFQSFKVSRFEEGNCYGLRTRNDREEGFKIRELIIGLVIFSCLLSVYGFGQDSDNDGIINLTEDISKNNGVSQEVNIINYVAILIVVMLIVGIYILFRMLNNKNSSNNKSIQVLDKFYLDSKIIIYVVKIYNEIVKIAVSKNGVTYLGGGIEYSQKSNEFAKLVNEGESKEKLGVSSTYMKIIDDINGIDDKIKKWQEKLKMKDG